MVKQVYLNLNIPLDVDAKPTLSKTALVPELATASSVLHGDYYVQQQGTLNSYILLSRLTVSVGVSIITLVLTYQLWDYIVISDSLAEFASFFLVKDFLFQIASSLPIFLFVSAIVGLISYLISDDLKEVSKNLVASNYIGDLFNFNLVEFAKLDKEGKLTAAEKAQLKLGENSQLFIYRGSPIAIATVVEEPQDASSTTFVVKITGLHVRKVFAKVDLDQMLLDWCILRSRQLFQDFVTAKKIKNISDYKIQVLIDAFNWDEKNTATIVKNGFTPVSESSQLNPFAVNELPTWQKVATTIYSIKRITYGLTIIPQEDDKEILSKLAPEAEEKQPSSIRKRH